MVIALRRFLILAILVASLVPQPIVAATDAISYRASFAAQVSDAGTLPTSPLYFLKEWGRGVKMFFTFNPAKKAEYELQIVNEKAAELSKIEQSDTGNKEKALDKALTNYETNIERLQTRLQNLDSSGNQDTQSLVDDLRGKLEVHQQLFSDLSQKYEVAKQEIERLQTKLDDTLKEKDKLQEKINAQSSQQGEGGSNDTGTPDSSVGTSANTVASPSIKYFNVRQVDPGDENTIYEFSWSGANAKYCTISDNVRNEEYFTGTLSTSGTSRKDLAGLTSAVFTLKCQSSSGEYDEKTVTVGIASPSTPSINYFDARQIKPGDDVNYELSWSSSNAEYCTLEDSGKGGAPPFSTTQHRSATGSIRLNLTGYSYGLFYLHCYNSDGAKDDSSVKFSISQTQTQVTEPKPQITSYKAALIDKTTNQYQFTWKSVNTIYCTLVSGPGANIFADNMKRSTDGSKKVRIPYSMKVLLTCYYSDSSYDTESINVSGP